MGATISVDRKYRYQLWRQWNIKLPRLFFVMLNPSTADADQDDPTIRKCVGFAGRNGFGGIYVMNLFAWRATSPAAMRMQYRRGDIVGPQNDDYLRVIANSLLGGDRVVLAWGAHAQHYRWRVDIVKPLLPVGRCWSLGLTKHGHPKHPLYVPYYARMEQYGL